jgi:class 3 adenylate cyclase
VEKGRVDLSVWSKLEAPESVALSGEWLFHPGELVGPTDDPSGFITRSVPGVWTDEVLHAGTYRLTINVSSMDKFGMLLPRYTSACRIFVNGRLVFEGGKVSKDFASYQASRDMTVLSLEGSLSYDIIIQVSNFLHARGGIFAPPIFGAYKTLLREESRRLTTESVIIGTFLAIGIYHLILFAIRRQRLVFYFAMACMAIAVRISFTNSMPIRTYLELDYATSVRIEYFSLYLMNPFLELYLANMFAREYPWRIFKFRLVCFAAVLLTAAMPIYYMTWLLKFCHMSHILGILICVYTVTRAKMNGRLGSRVIFHGILVFSVFLLWDVYISLQSGLTSSYLFHWGFLVFILSQSGAIAQAYDDTFNKLVATEAAKHHSLEQLAKVFFPHQIAAIRQNKQLEDTMPTNPGQGCVISFDIVASSRIKHIKAKEFFRKVFARCNQTMAEGYDGINLKARAYRIKEMGDGFLCSIGYPFQSLTDNPAHDAIDLARDFARILEEESTMLHANAPVACGIGIALGPMTGFFPESGTKEYDIYGQAIMLATRYENLRKTLFESEVTGSIIIIQEQVYQSLDPQHREGFVAMDLRESGFTVRDDPSATHLYYQILKSPLARNALPSPPAEAV